MYLLNSAKHGRRAFLQRIARLAAVGAGAPLGLNLAAIGEAAALTATDYKALVCVFLYGGNDHANTVINFDLSNWSAYQAIRQGTGASGLAIDRSALASSRLQPPSLLQGGFEYALHPAMGGVVNLFNSGRAAVLLNVGPLVRPTTQAEYFSLDRARYPLPPQLMSHSDQTVIWQSKVAEGGPNGWGGSLGDFALSSNENSLFTCISTTGNAVFLSGDHAVQYQLSSAGAVSIDAVKDGPNGLRSQAYSARAAELMRALITEPRSHVLENEYNRITSRSIDAEGKLTSALADIELKSPFPAGNTLADQLAIVARTIGARSALGTRRQVFMVSLDGFDLHDNLVDRQPTLLRKVSDALSAFYRSTVELGVADQVTTFTASDFGRTLVSNGNGTDHGWGGHHFIIGGAVRGQEFYGTPPPVSATLTNSLSDQWHVGQGRLLPSTSVDQYAATLARWFGVADTELNAILPNLRNFGAAAGRSDYPTNLGFMR